LAFCSSAAWCGADSQAAGQELDDRMPQVQPPQLGVLRELLGLTPDQAAKLQTLLQRQREAHLAEREALRRQIEQRRQQELQQIEALLDSRQIPLYRAFQKGIEARRAGPSVGLGRGDP
jgi:hypothetical protein